MRRGLRKMGGETRLPTVRAALESLEADLFVGRQAESEEFVAWLAAGSTHPQILQVTGHAGVGKSALLRSFVRQAPIHGRLPVVAVDGEAISPSPGEFIRAATGDGIADLASFLGARPALLVIDGIEELAPLTRWLTTTVLPSLDENVRVIIAGRQPVGPMWKAWHSAMRTIRLESLPLQAASDYLERRGVVADVAGQILETAGGYPLALTMAADLAVQHGVARFEKAPEWSLTLRGLVDELLRDAPELRPLVEAAAVVRQFDEPTLAAVAGIERAGPAFAQLCAASFVRPSQHGLTLHDDVRRVVIEELQWRNPERLAYLRKQARGYYRARLHKRLPGEEWLAPERMYLWEHTVRATYFPPSGESWTMWVETAGPDDMDELLTIQAEFVAALEAGAPLPALPPPEECSPDVLRAIVSLPGTEVRIARSPDGVAHGYGFSLPLSQAARAILPADGAIARVIETALPAEVQRSLPATADGSAVTYMSAAAVRGQRAAEAVGSLAADWFRGALRGGTFLACTGNDTAAQVSAALGGTRIPGVGRSSVKPPRVLDGYVFNIERISPDLWLEAVASGQPPPVLLSAEQLQLEIHSVLTHWTDDARVAASQLVPLARLLASPEDAASPAAAVRAVMRDALREVCARGDEDKVLACTALELAYFDRKLAHEAIAERLNVSRTSFYRLLHRAEAEIAERLSIARDSQ